MATVQKVGDGAVFLITWSTNNPGYYGHPSEANVNIDEISQSLKLSFKRMTSNATNVLEVEVNPSPSTTDKKLQVLKPASVKVIENSFQQPTTVLQNSKWTATCTGYCQCGSASTGSIFQILIDFGSAACMKTESRRVLEHLLNLWETKKLADVTFKFIDKEVKAHTLIIASGSPVLAAMFQNDFKEKRDKVVEIKDIKSSVFEKMLQYIYTGNADLVSVDVADLMVVADKYRVEALKEECAIHLAKNLTEENSIRYLVLSHLHEAPSLHKSALEFISRNAGAIVSRKDWVDLMKNYHELCLAAVQLMILTKK